MSYFFRDCDDVTNKEQNITGNDFVQIINTCFKFSCEFSILVMRDILDEYQSANPKPARTGPSKYEDCWVALYYKCNEDTLDYLLKIHPQMFPNDDAFFSLKSIWDLTFLRNDDTVFMSIVTHEGVCTLRPHYNEDVSLIVNKKGWYWLDGDSYYTIPPKIYKLLSGNE